MTDIKKMDWDRQIIGVQQAQFLARRRLFSQEREDPAAANGNGPISLNRISIEYLVFAAGEYLRGLTGSEEWPLKEDQDSQGEIVGQPEVKD